MLKFRSKIFRLPFPAHKLMLAAGGGVCALAAAFFLFAFLPKTNAAESSVSTPAESMIDVRFINTQTYADGNGYSGGAATLFKTKDNKYVLLDTGNSDSRTITRIKDVLKEWQNSPSVLTLDFLIISHLDGDHYGNAIDIISDSKIKVKNVVIKEEATLMETQRKNHPSDPLYGRNWTYTNIVSATMAEGAKLYTNGTSYKVDGIAVKSYSGYKKLNQEGTGNAKISLGKYLTMYFFNTTDAFAGMACVEGQKANWTPRGDSAYILKDSKGKARVLDNSAGTYPDTPLTSVSSTPTVNNGGFNRKWYWNDISAGGTVDVTKNTCLSNGNSYAVLFEVPTAAQNKYIYIPSDIENVGFEVIPRSTNVSYFDVSKGKEVSKTMDVFGNSSTTLYPKVTASNVFNHKVVSGQTYVPSETVAALEVASLLGSKLKDISIFQVSHHGVNNAPDAIATLGLNRDDVWGINSNDTSLSSSTSIASARMYHYTLSNVTGSSHYRFTGRTAYDYKGVYCQINSYGSSFCDYRGAKTYNLLYDSNGSSQTISKASSCMTASSCSVKVTSEEPYRDGYKFLGWSNKSSDTQPAYSAGSKITLSDDKTVYALWAQNRTLSFDANGGAAAPASLSCASTTTNGSCSVTIPTSEPTRSGYNFVGWASSKTATSASVFPGKKFSLTTASAKLYAVWTEIIPEPEPEPIPEEHTFTLTLDANGGSFSSGSRAASCKTTASSCSVSVPATTVSRSGYNFLGWADSATATSSSYSSGSSVSLSANKILYAVWQVIPTPTPDPEPTPDPTPTPDPEPTPDPTPVSATYTLYFSSANSGSGFPSSVSCTIPDISTSSSCSVVVPSSPIPSRSGYSFLGYSTYASRSVPTYAPGSVVNLTSSLTLVASWAPVRTLSFDLSGGSGNFSTLSCSSTASSSAPCALTLPSSVPEKPGYAFFGWSESVNATTPDYLPGSTFTFSSGLTRDTLYAVWLVEEVSWGSSEGSYEQSSDKNLVLKISFPKALFERLKLDDVVVSAEYYLVRSGSTIIELDSAYLDTLEPGNHVLTAEYSSDLSVSTELTITAQDSPEPTHEETEPESAGDDDEFDPLGPAESDSSSSDPATDSTADNNSSSGSSPNTGRATKNPDGFASFVSSPSCLPLLLALPLIGYILLRRLSKKSRTRSF